MRNNNCKAICRCRYVCNRGKDTKRDSINVQETYKILNETENSMLIDVRSKQEYDEGHLIGSYNVSVYDLERYVDKIIPYKDMAVIVYCQTGSRSIRAKEFLKKKGYKNVYNLEGGLDTVL